MGDMVDIPSERLNARALMQYQRDAQGKVIVTDEMLAIGRRQLSYMNTWSQDRVLAPIPDSNGLFIPNWSRDTLLLDQGFNPKSRRRLPGVDAYYDTFRLTYRAEGAVPGFVDSTGVPHAFPDGVARFRQLRIEAQLHHAWTAGPGERESWLLFQNTDGHALLLLPAYGWSSRDQLEPWGKAIGWDYRPAWNVGDVVHRFMTDLEGDFPGVNTCPFAVCGGPLITAEERARKVRHRR